MTDDDLLRYSRHLLLDDIGIEGQRRLLAAHALVIGAGGLGSPVALYLGTAGVGRITIVDGDRVDLTNLQRQIAHDLARIGVPKAESAARSIAAINPNVSASPRCMSASTRPGCSSLSPTPTSWSTAATTSRPARPSTRRAWRALGRSSPAPRSASTVSSRSTTPACRSRRATPARSRPTRPFEDVACATMGVFAPLVGIIGSIQAAEALKLLVGIGTALVGPAADARRAHDGMDRDARRSRSRLPRVSTAR